MKLVSVVIINWNGMQFLENCLQSLFSQKYKNIEVIVVDNASTDGSIIFIKKRFPKVKLILNKKNLGFADANNIGYSKSKGDYILFLNNDTKVTQNFLTELVKPFEKNKNIGGVQSKIFLMNEPKMLDSVGAFLTNTGFLYHYGVSKKDSPTYSKEVIIFSAKGACMLFRRDVLEKITVENKIFDPRYFAYFEETDLCHRAWLAGFTIEFVPNSQIFHVMGGSSKKLVSEFVQYHSFKNRINSYIKNFEMTTLFKILSVHIIMCEVISTMYLLKGKFKLFFAIQCSIYWNIINLNETLRMRETIQKRIRHVKDNQILPVIMKNVPLNYYLNLFSGLRFYKDIKI